MTEPRVGRAAFALGFAGLLPQAVAVLAWVADSRSAGAGDDEVQAWPWVLGEVYPLIILSFLGGIWWGFAMRRGRGQGQLSALAVLPSLAVVPLLCLMPVLDALGVRGYDGVGWTLVTVGSAVILMLPVDRALVRAGDAPTNWMRLRVPLSLGLGGLTILLGVLVGSSGIPV